MAIHWIKSPTESHNLPLRIKYIWWGKSDCTLLSYCKSFSWITFLNVFSWWFKVNNKWYNRIISFHYTALNAIQTESPLELLLIKMQNILLYIYTCIVKMWLQLWQLMQIILCHYWQFITFTHHYYRLWMLLLAVDLFSPRL